MTDLPPVNSRNQWLVVGAAFIAASARILLLVNRYSVNVLVGDQWFYDQPTLFHRQSLWGIFRWESNPWRQGLGGLLQALIQPAFHWNSRAESFFAVILVMIACLLAIVLKWRVTGKLEYWDAMLAIVMLTPACYETFVGVVHFSHGPLPIILLFAIALSWSATNPHIRYSLIALFTGLSICTGFGFISGTIVPLILLAELRFSESRGLRIVAIGIIAATWCLFFYGYSLSNTGCPANGISTKNPIHYFLYVAFMFANAIGVNAQQHLLLAILLGSLLVCCAGYFLLRSFAHPIPLLLISFSLMFAISSSLGRMCLGLGVALGSRYLIYLVPAFLGCYLLIASDDAKHRLTSLGLLAMITVSVALPHSYDSLNMRALSQHRQSWANCYVQNRNLQMCNSLTGATVLTFPSDISPQLQFLEAHRLNLFSSAR